MSDIRNLSTFHIGDCFSYFATSAVYIVLDVGLHYICYDQYGYILEIHHTKEVCPISLKAFLIRENNYIGDKG